MKFYVIWSLVWFFVFAIMTYSAHGSITLNDEVAGIKSMTASVMMGLFITWFSVAPSMVFAGLKTKQQRIGYFSLPATNLEKFVSSFVVVTVGTLGVTILGGWTADILRFIFKAIIGDYNSHMVMMEVARSIADLPGSNIDINGESDPTAVYVFLFSIAMGFCYTYTLYLFGGVVFRKAQWLMTSIVIVILMMVSVAFVNKFFVIEGIAEAILFLKVLSAIFAALSVFNVWASYKVFTRMQVINNKWLNL